MSDAGVTSQANVAAPQAGAAVLPVTIQDIRDVLAAGWRDFRVAPGYDFVLGGIYAVGGWVLILMLLKMDLPFLVYPLAAGFALIAPFVAATFYGISRNLEENQPLCWDCILGSVRQAIASDLGWMALVTVFSLIIWMDIAALLFFGFFGLRDFSATEFLQTVFTTPMGLLFLVIGNGLGALISLAIFSLTVISFPMLYDRNVSFVTAMITSVKVMLANKLTMVMWCATIVVLISISMALGLLGLFVVLPVLGHASWHLYRRAVAPAS